MHNSVTFSGFKYSDLCNHHAKLIGQVPWTHWEENFTALEVLWHLKIILEKEWGLIFSEDSDSTASRLTGFKMKN